MAGLFKNLFGRRVVCPNCGRTTVFFNSDVRREVSNVMISTFGDYTETTMYTVCEHCQRKIGLASYSYID